MEKINNKQQQQKQQTAKLTFVFISNKNNKKKNAHIFLLREKYCVCVRVSWGRRHTRCVWSTLGASEIIQKH